MIAIQIRAQSLVTGKRRDRDGGEVRRDEEAERDNV
jgi:hypothetical protein